MGISLHRGTRRGGFSPRVFERRVKEDSGNEASLSMGALRGEPGGGLLYGGL
jgi:hypothetical protein